MWETVCHCFPPQQPQMSVGSVGLASQVQPADTDGAQAIVCKGLYITSKQYVFRTH